MKKEKQLEIINEAIRKELQDPSNFYLKSLLEKRDALQEKGPNTGYMFNKVIPKSLLLKNNNDGTLTISFIEKE